MEDGAEVFEASEIPDHTDVYISMGENYKDPFGDTKSMQYINGLCNFSAVCGSLPSYATNSEKSDDTMTEIKHRCPGSSTKMLCLKLFFYHLFMMYSFWIFSSFSI